LIAADPLYHPRQNLDVPVKAPMTTTDPTPSVPVPTHKLEAQRRENRAAVAALGLKPYGQRTGETDLIADIKLARERYDADADAAHQQASKDAKAAGGAGGPIVDTRPTVTVAGRVVLHRDNGKLVWMNLRDHTSDVQVAVSQRECVATGFQLGKLTDLGDVLVARGRLMKTKTGEVTIWADDLSPASKCLVPPPEKHAGLQDTEIRYRQRYVDLWANPETLSVFTLRSRIVTRMRQYLEARDFLEVETPMLQTLAGGAAARPFSTHMNALDIDLFMRIAPELYLKRLLVGGLPRVFEINRNFRNEGLDKQHNPEFTMLEVYQAFGDVTTVMDLTEGLIRDAATMVVRSNVRSNVQANANAAEEPAASVAETDLRLPFGELSIDYGSPFLRVTYGSLFEKNLGFEMANIAKARAEAQRRGLKVKNEKGEPIDDAFIVNELFETFAEKTVDPSRPTFITDYPSAISPLTRPKPSDPTLADRADLFIAHMEIAPHYTELNDPDVQEAKFREQLKGLDDEESTFRNFDEDFVRALKVGMPPAGGLGLGIDRLVMVLTNQRTIRDVMLFPMMRPEV